MTLGPPPVDARSDDAASVPSAMWKPLTLTSVGHYTGTHLQSPISQCLSAVCGVPQPAHTNASSTNI